MKTHKNLYPQICTFENLLLASQKAQKGKRFQENVASFNFHLEANLHRLLKELTTQTYQPGAYKEFHIYEPKPRMISAAPYQDRVVHHALCNVIEPILDKSMIYDTYANRQGKGTHKAILRYQKFSKSNKYVLKCDIRKFFPSIDHEILKQILRRKIACPKTLWLLDTIIDNSNPQEAHDAFFPKDDLFSSLRKKGLPIGNLTSQLFGNYYLSRFDHFIKDDLGCQHYIRYVDDFVVLDNDKAKLQDIKTRMEAFLAKYRLKLHPNKSQVHQVAEGIGFLGHRIFPEFRLLKNENVRRFKKRARRLLKDYYNEKISLEQFNQSMIGWFGHAVFSNTWRLRTKLFQQIYVEGKL